MAIYIKGAKLPKSCWSCWRCTSINIVDCAISLGEESASNFRGTRHPKCPLVYIPEPHGRLIDADEVDWVKYNQDVGYLTQYQQGWNDGVDRTLREIDDAPTVIEAEDGEGK